MEAYNIIKGSKLLAALSPFSQLRKIAGVDWFVEQRKAQTSLRAHQISTEPLQLAHTKKERK